MALAFVLLWNSGFIGAEFVLPYIGVFSLMFWRYSLLALLLVLFLMLRNRLRWPGVATAMFESAIGLLAHGAWLACVIIALERGVPAGIVALVVALQPMATGALSGLLTGESVSWRRWIGLLVAFAGVALAVTARVDTSDGASIVAYLLPFGAALSITLASLLERRATLRDESPSRMPMTLALFYQALATAMVFAVPAFALEGFHAEPNPAFIAAMAWLVVGVSLAAYALMWMLIERTDATRVASLFYLGPPVTMLMSWLAFGDTVTSNDLAGLGIVACGVALVQTRQRPTDGMAPEA
ncbi:MAG: EamA family transporter [Xanthomonadales bacterium]|nr:EamA family transporter [Xanthomonadales bacterium]|tara:strand:+ start:257 stop:1150 length:894 start_codon:yes stop_codon:yes gene_type:complete